MKLLYAEDEPAMAEAVTDILNYHNFMVDAVADGLEALEYARAGDYDGIILDIMLPKKSGLEVLRELRSTAGRVTLTRLEYRMMEALMLNRGIYLSTEELLVKVWGYETEAGQGAVWVYVSYLRKRLGTVGSRVRIRARRGVGYTLEDSDA